MRRGEEPPPSLSLEVVAAPQFSFSIFFSSIFLFHLSLEYHARCRIDILHHEYHIVKRQLHGQTIIIHCLATNNGKNQINHKIHKLLIRLNLGQIHAHHVPIGIRSDGFNKRSFASARRTVQQHTKFFGNPSIANLPCPH